MNSSDILKKLIPKQLSEGKDVILHVTGRSMLPYLSGAKGECVIVSKHTDSELKPGAIILFVENGRFIFHRILKRKGQILIVQGDGNYATLEIVDIKNVLGIIRNIKRKNKLISPSDFWGRIYWRFWYCIRPIRKYVLFGYKKIIKYEA